MNWLVTCVIVLVALVAALTWVVARLHSRVEALRKVVSEEWNELLAAQQTLKEITTQRIGERLDSVETHLDEVAEEQQQMLMRDGAISAYSEAIRKARAGAGVAELVSDQQIGQAEAELIVRLYARETKSD